MIEGEKKEYLEKEYQEKQEKEAQAILRAVNKIKPKKAETGVIFDYDGGLKFWVIYSPEVEEKEAFYSGSSQVANFDIYLNGKFTLEEFQRRLFHEVFEIHLFNDCDYDQEVAHQLAQAKEEQLFGIRKEE